MDEGRQGLGGEDGQDAPVSPLIDGAAGGSNAPTPHPRTPQDTRPSTRRSPVLVILRVLVAVLAVVAVLATGAGWVTLNWFRHSANTTDVLSELDQQPGAPPADDGADDILLIGDDSRTDAQGNPLPEDVLKALRTTANPGVNTDTIILLRIPKHGGKAYAISIPRDTYVSIPGIGYNKINAAFELTRVKAAHQLRANGVTDARTISQRSQRAGRKALVSTVQKLTGARVDHYAEINLYGFYLLSRAIGGVDVCLRAPAHDKDSGADFPSGPQTVSGSDALSFVRQRKNIPGGDIGRIQRQQVFLASAAHKLLSAGTLTNPRKLSALADTARKSLLMDPGLDLLTLAQQAQSLAAGNVTFITIPVITINGHSPSGQSIVQVDPKRVRDFVSGLALGAGAPKTSTPVRPSAYVVTTHGVPARSTPTPPVTVDGTRCVY